MFLLKKEKKKETERKGSHVTTYKRFLKTSSGQQSSQGGSGWSSLDAFQPGYTDTTLKQHWTAWIHCTRASGSARLRGALKPPQLTHKLTPFQMYRLFFSPPDMHFKEQGGKNKTLQTPEVELFFNSMWIFVHRRH